jgi:hypothetical protein
MADEPTYVGDWDEDPTGGRTLHINQPTDCRCGTAQQLGSNPTAIFFNDLNTAHNAGFTNHCSECAGKGPQCAQLLPFNEKT